MKKGEDDLRELTRNISAIILQVQNIHLSEWSAENGAFTTSRKESAFLITRNSADGCVALFVDGVWICENDTRVSGVFESVDAYMKMQETEVWRGKVKDIAKKFLK